jgi:C-terminal processing protease CtpA/Prc
MSRQFHLFLVLFFFLLNTAGAAVHHSSSGSASRGADEDKAVIEALLHRLDGALEAGDLPAALACFLHGGQVISLGIDQREKALGWNSLAGLLQAQSESVRNLKIRQKELIIYIDSATATARYTRSLDISFISQSMPFVVKGARETGVLLFAEGGWRIVQQHTSAPVTDETWPAYLVPAVLPGNVDPLQGKFPPGLLRSDFDLLRQALEEGHAGLYRYTAKEELDRLFNDLNGKIAAPMSENDFFRLVAPLIARIRCVHTAVSPSAATWKRLREEGLFFPLDLAFLGGKAYLVRCAGQNPPIPPGSQIMAINGRPMEEIIGELLGVIPSDGFNVTYKYRILDREFPEKYALHIGRPDEFRITFLPSKQNANPRVVSLAAVPYPTLTRNRPGFEKFYKNCLHLEIRKGDKTAVMTIKTFVPRIIQQFKLDFHAFLASSFQEMKEQRIGHLILDLRDNDGGDSGYLTELLSHLIDKPFAFLERVDTPRVRYSFLEYTDKGLFFNRFHPSLWERDPGGGYLLRGNWNRTYSPSPSCFKGRIIVLINGMSISASADAAALLHFHKRAVFIGEETGGAYRGNNSGDFLNLTLPFTKIRVRIPIRRSLLAVSGYSHPDRGLIPDYQVEPSIEDVVRGRDPIMALACRLIQQQGDQVPPLCVLISRRGYPVSDRCSGG